MKIKIIISIVAIIIAVVIYKLYQRSLYSKITFESVDWITKKVRFGWGGTVHETIYPINQPYGIAKAKGNFGYSVEIKPLIRVNSGNFEDGVVIILMQQGEVQKCEVDFKAKTYKGFA